MKPPPRRQPTAGVTLIEMMIALALFALIGSAGFTMLDQVLRAQSRSEGRLEHLARIERALHLVLLDFAMAEPHSLTTDPPGINRSSTGGSLTLHYRLTGTTWHRELADTSGAPLADQPILTGVDSVSWRFLTPEGQWSPTWPTDTTPTLATPRNPRAVEVLLTLQGGKGSLRRVAPLPADLE